MKLLHTMLRVGDMQRSIDFYTKVMGMNLVRRTDRPDQGYSLAFIAFNEGNKSGDAEIELTHNHDTSEYDLGSAYGHIALGLEDVTSACNRIREAGGKITREPGPVKGGTTFIAFVEDPDGYKIELIQRDAS